MTSRLHSPRRDEGCGLSVFAADQLRRWISFWRRDELVYGGSTDQKLIQLPVGQVLELQPQDAIATTIRHIEPIHKLRRQLTIAARRKSRSA
jgi:hypothetical protein